MWAFAVAGQLQGGVHPFSHTDFLPLGRKDVEFRRERAHLGSASFAQVLVDEVLGILRRQPLELRLQGVAQRLVLLRRRTIDLSVGLIRLGSRLSSLPKQIQVAFNIGVLQNS